MMRRHGAGASVSTRFSAPPRVRRRGASGVTLVEFAFVAPVAFLLICGIVVVGIVATNFVQLSNAARDGARVAAICGSNPADTTQMPDGSGVCSFSAVQTYITKHLVAVPSGSVTPTLYVCSADQTSSCATSGTECTLDSSGYGICNCQAGKIVEVDMQYDQPLYLPLISTLLQTSPPGNGTRRLLASAQATCEQ